MYGFRIAIEADIIEVGQADLALSNHFVKFKAWFLICLDHSTLHYLRPHDIVLLLSCDNDLALA